MQLETPTFVGTFPIVTADGTRLTVWQWRIAGDRDLVAAASTGRTPPLLLEKRADGKFVINSGADQTIAFRAIDADWRLLSTMNCQSDLDGLSPFFDDISAPVKQVEQREHRLNRKAL